MASNLDNLDLLVLGVLSLSQFHLRPEEVLVVKIKILISFGTLPIPYCSHRTYNQQYVPAPVLGTVLVAHSSSMDPNGSRLFRIMRIPRDSGSTGVKDVPLKILGTADTADGLLLVSLSKGFVHEIHDRKACKKK
jgi:hypothetical protein